MVAVVGRLQVNTWEDQQKVKHTSIDVVAEEQHFAGSKNDNPTQNAQQSTQQIPQDDDDLPF